MDNLTKIGLDYANHHKEELEIFAKKKFDEGCEEDDWFGYDFVRNCEEDEQSERGNCLDINIWVDDSGARNVWKAAAYPMEINNKGEIQTDGCNWVSLW